LCQSSVDCKISDEIRKKHVPGKWCKERNHCMYCSETRHLIRVLKHYSVVDCRSKKCPVCVWLKDSRQAHNANFYENPNARKRIVIRLYRLMLGITYKNWRYHI